MRPLLLALATFLLPAVLRAQLCAGTASYRAGAFAAAVSAERTGDATLFLGHLSYGNKRGGFVSGNAGRAAFGDSDAHSTMVGGSAGFEKILTIDDRLAVCPIVTTFYETSDDGVVESAVFALTLGLTIGREVPVSPRASVTPFGHFAVVRKRIMLRDIDDEFMTHDVQGLLRLGAGLVLNRTLTLKPTVSFALAVVDAEPVYGLAIQANFGRTR